MNKVTELLKMSLPLTIGVVAGLFIYDQIKSAMAKAKA